MPAPRVKPSVDPRLEELIAYHAGLRLDPRARRRLAEAVAERLAATGARSEAEYVQRVTRPRVDERELDVLAAALSVGETHFLRAPQQLAALAARVLPRLAAERPGPVRVWCAGCASGEEAYTIALLGSEIGVPVAVLGTDLDAAAIARARAGRYRERALRKLDEATRRRHFTRAADGLFQVRPALAAACRFRAGSLKHLPARGPFDLILCRNVLLYFSRVEARLALRRFATLLRDGGVLALGAAEASHARLADLEPDPGGGALFVRAPRATRRPVRDAESPPARRPPDDLASARAAFDAGDVAAALAAAERALSADPFAAEAHLMRGLLLERAGRTADAAAAYLRATTLDPAFAMAWSCLARVREGSGDRVGARAARERARAAGRSTHAGSRS